MASKKRKASTVTDAASRKERRREERLARKKHKSGRAAAGGAAGHNHADDDPAADRPPIGDPQSSADGDAGSDRRKKQDRRSKGSKKAKKQGRKDGESGDRDEDPYAGLGLDVAAAMRNDDAEIAALEEKLGLGSSSSGGGGKDKKKLHKEYAKLEGYGDDFGNFLDGIDGMVDRCIAGGGDHDAGFDGSDDEEGGVMSGHFDGTRFVPGGREDGGSVASSSSSSDGEDVVPMKGEPLREEDDVSSGESGDGGDDSDDVEESSPSSDRGKNERGGTATKDESGDDSASEGGSSHASSDVSDGSDSEREGERDHSNKLRDTYAPSTGEDIYGKQVDGDGASGGPPRKYVPPHLRKKAAESQGAQGGRVDDSKEEDPEREESLKTIRRSLNNALNRLSDQTLDSVARSVAGLYQSRHPARDVNACLWANIKSACVPPHLVMSGLVPLYAACVAGAHFLTSAGKVQLGGYVVEECVVALWEEMRASREGAATTAADPPPAPLGDDDDALVTNKTASNLTLLLCYLYNYNVVHCMLLYDIVRDLISHFTEVDVELLLLVLSHCGHQLRSDDPTALKDIVLLVQERAVGAVKAKAATASGDSAQTAEGDGAPAPSSSRVQYMVLAMTDLKNNKRRKKDVAIGERTVRYRKVIGRLKSAASEAGGTSESCLRLTLADILNAEERGRWWCVGASWVGKQFHRGDSRGGGSSDEAAGGREKKKGDNDSEDRLLALASRQRMNTDARRSIFCVIMGGADCEDAFEKLVRGGMLRGKSERDVVRVLMDCCGQERSFNPYYAHLAARLCQYQPRAKFTFQLAFWDAFKQFEKSSMKARRAANLAKLLAHLVGTADCLTLHILKAVEVTPNDMPESAVIFLTIFFTNVFESVADASQVMTLFQRSFTRRGKGMESAESVANGDSDRSSQGDDVDALKGNISVFLLQYLKSSPKNAKKSAFRKCWKAAVKVCEEEDFGSMLGM